MRIFINANCEKTASRICTERVVGELQANGATVLLGSENHAYTGGLKDCVYGDAAELVETCDVLLSVGGDGSMIRTVRQALKVDKPVLGVNAGRVGFMTQLELHELEQLHRLVSGDYKIADRMVLQAAVTKGGKQTYYTAVNEVVLTEGKLGKIMEADVLCEDRLVMHYRADGIIFATPTGSTAYNLSAGGTVLDPFISAIQITPICPFSTFKHPMVVSAECSYTVRQSTAKTKKNHGMHIIVDGANVATLVENDSFTLKKSETKAKFIDLGLRDFYTNLREKLC